MPISTTVRRDKEGAPQLLSLELAGVIAWLIAVACAVVIYLALKPPTKSISFASAVMGSTGLFFWVVFDAARLCSKFRPDECARSTPASALRFAL